MIPIELEDILSSDPETLSGTVCFARTRIPVRILFDYVNGGSPLDEFLEDYPSVTKAMALRVLESEKMTALSKLEPIPA